MFDPFGNQLYRAGLRATFSVQSDVGKAGMLQSMYDDGISGPALSRVFDLTIADVYGRIDAHRGRGPARPART